MVFLLFFQTTVNAQELSLSYGITTVQMLPITSKLTKFNQNPLPGASLNVKYYDPSLKRFVRHNEIGIEFNRLGYYYEYKNKIYDTMSNTQRQSKFYLQIKNYPINIYLSKKKKLLFSAGIYAEFRMFQSIKFQRYAIYYSTYLNRVDTFSNNFQYRSTPDFPSIPVNAGIALQFKTKSLKINKYNVGIAYNVNIIPFNDLIYNPFFNLFFNHRLEININKNFDAKKELHNYRLLQDQRISTRKANNFFRKNHNLELMFGTNHFNYMLMPQFNYISHNNFRIIQGFQVGVRIWNPFKLKNHGIELQFSQNKCTLERYYNQLDPTTVFSLNGYVKNSSLYLTYYPLSINIARNLLDVKFGFFGGLNLFQNAAYSMDYQSPFYKRSIAFSQYNNNPYSLFNKFVYGLNVLASVPVYTKEKFAIKLQGQSRFSFNEFKLKEAKLSGICNQFQVACSFKLKSQK